MTAMGHQCDDRNTFVGNDLVDFNATGASDNQLGSAVVDAFLDLQGGESSKNNLKKPPAFNIVSASILETLKALFCILRSPLTLCVTPRRAQASMEIKASGTMGTTQEGLLGLNIKSITNPATHINCNHL